MFTQSHTPSQSHTITVSQLRKELENWPDDFEVQFAGGLEFYRFKVRGERLVQIEFNQSVYKDRNGRWHVDY
ncbi:MAG TPA: hypothetical protein PLU35_02030 [Phycisphaerales bacterium]|nr:hypothetical protein [Phycisphaerales bacterium]